MINVIVKESVMSIEEYKEFIIEQYELLFGKEIPVLYYNEKENKEMIGFGERVYVINYPIKPRVKDNNHSNDFVVEYDEEEGRENE